MIACWLSYHGSAFSASIFPLLCGQMNAAMASASRCAQFVHRSTRSCPISSRSLRRELTARNTVSAARGGMDHQHVAHHAEQIALHAPPQGRSGARTRRTANEDQPLHGIALGKEEGAGAALPRSEQKKAAPGLAGAEQLCVHRLGHGDESTRFKKRPKRRQTALGIAQNEAFGHARSFRGACGHACPSFLMMSWPAMTSMRSALESTVPGIGEGST